MPVSLGLSITQNSQNSTTKTTNVTVALTIYWTGGSYNGYSKPGTVTIDGTSYDFTASFNYANGSGPVSATGSVVAYTKTVDIAHDSDGTKSLYCTATYESGTMSGTVWTTASRELTPFDTGGDTNSYLIHILQGDHTTIDAVYTHETFGELGLVDNMTLASGTEVRVSFSADEGYELTIHAVNGENTPSAESHTFIVDSETTIVSEATLIETPEEPGSGTIHIDNGSNFVSYEIYIDNGTSWDAYAAYIDNGTSWDLYG